MSRRGTRELPATPALPDAVIVRGHLVHQIGVVAGAQDALDAFDRLLASITTHAAFLAHVTTIPASPPPKGSIT